MPQPIRQNMGRHALGGGGIGVRDYIGGTSGAGMAGMQVAQRDTSLSSTPVGGGSGAGAPPLDIYGQGSPQVEKTALMRNLDETDMGIYKGARTVMSGLIPGASAMFSAAEYNLGKNGYNPAVDKALRDDANFANTYNAGRVAGAFPSATGVELTEHALATSKLGGAAGLKTGYAQLSDGAILRSSDGAMMPANFGSWNNGMGYTAPDPNKNPDGTPVANPSYSIETMMGGTTPQASPNESGGSSGAGSSFGGYSPSGNESMSMASQYSAYGSGGGGWSFADGGMVGLTGPMYSGVNQAPATLTQLGFADGGMVAGMGAQVQPEQIQSQVAQMVRNPQFQQVAQRVVGTALQSGELTPEELMTLGRIAEAAMHNPQLYPQLRQFAMQNGMTPLPDAFDPKIIMVLMAASQIMGRTPPGQVPPTDVAQMQNPNGQPNGGYLQGPGTGRSDSIGTVEESTGKPVKVANGEYVIPKHVVDAKGRDFFDKMLRQYAPLTPQE